MDKQQNKEIPNLQTLAKLWQQSTLVSTRGTQNVALARCEMDADDSPDLLPVVPSVFGNEPAASEDEVKMAIATLAACFPQQTSMFWGFVAKQAIKKCLSRARLEYIVERVTLNHKFPTITMADIFGVDKSIHTLTYDEISALIVPHKPLAQIYFNGKYYIVYADDAEKCGYVYAPYESMAERDAREKKERDERWEKEYEEMVKNGEIDPNAPIVNDFHQLSQQIADGMSVKRRDEQKAKERRIYAIRQRVIKANQKLFDTDPDNAFDRINEKINEELKKARLL